MGVYIPGIPMPESCAICVLDRFCKHWDIRSDRHEDCPLIPVPPHGDLIDKDKTIREFERYFGKDPFTERIIKSVDTVIPAEGDTDFYTKGHLHLGYAEEGGG